MKNLDRFMEVYAGQLLLCVKTYPDEYSYPESEVPAVLDRVRAARTT